MRRKCCPRGWMLVAMGLGIVLAILVPSFAALLVIGLLMIFAGLCLLRIF